MITLYFPVSNVKKCFETSISYSKIVNNVTDYTGLEESQFYLIHNGRILCETANITEGNVYSVGRLVGGKGGFGSMLRAIGAQIEKTTNSEACRDLSGRRLRDINEEKRLKNWIAQQAERDQEAAERRQKKLEKLCLEPKHEFKDKKYEEERSVLTEKVCEAVEQGFKATTSKVGSLKRKQDDAKLSVKKKKKSCLWIDADAEDFSSLDDSCSDEEGNNSLSVNKTKHLHLSSHDSSDSASCSEVKVSKNSEETVPVM